MMTDTNGLIHHAHKAFSAINTIVLEVYFLFRSVHELYIQTQSTLQRVVLNVHEALQEIVSHFGSRARAIYFNSS